MGLKETILEGVLDRYVAVAFAKSQEPTYTVDGDLGRITKARIFTGTIEFHSFSGNTRVLPAKMIGDPETFPEPPQNPKI